MLASPPLSLMVNSQVKHTDKWTLLAASHVTVYIQVRRQKGNSTREKKHFSFFAMQSVQFTLFVERHPRQHGA